MELQPIRRLTSKEKGHKPESKILTWIKKLFGYCPKHGWLKYPYRYRTNTQYVDEENNYEFGCKECEKESDEYWKDMWADFYSF